MQSWMYDRELCSACFGGGTGGFSTHRAVRMGLSCRPRCHLSGWAALTQPSPCLQNPILPAAVPGQRNLSRALRAGSALRFISPGRIPTLRSAVYPPGGCGSSSCRPRSAPCPRSGSWHGSDGREPRGGSAAGLCEAVRASVLLGLRAALGQRRGAAVSSVAGVNAPPPPPHPGPSPAGIRAVWLGAGPAPASLGPASEVLYERRWGCSVQPRSGTARRCLQALPCSGCTAGLKAGL